MTFQPSASDILISTRNWTDGEDPFCNWTEQIYHRGSKVEGVKVKTKRMPKQISERRKWAKFGSVSRDGKEKGATSVAGDVFMEYTKPDIEPSAVWEPNGQWVSYAKQEKWTHSEISKIKKSEDPAEVYKKIYLGRIATTVAEIKAKRAAKEGTTGGVAAKVDTTGMGLRERLLLKKQQRDNASDTETPTRGSSSLSARMNKMRGASQRDEQKCTLFVMNVPDDYTVDNIKSHLDAFQYRRVNIVQRDGRSMGKAFIELESIEEAQACLTSINGARWGYNVIEAQVSRPKKRW
jgi:hypothetical protein